MLRNRSDWVTGYYARCFSSFYTCFCFELFEVFKDPEFEADLPSSAPVYLQFVWGSCFRVACQMSVANVLSEYLLSCLRMSLSLYFTATSLLMYLLCTSACLGSLVSFCCQVSPKVLFEYRKSAWGRYTCFCWFGLSPVGPAPEQVSTSRRATGLLPSASDILLKYLWSVWGSLFSLFPSIFYLGELHLSSAGQQVCCRVLPIYC